MELTKLLTADFDNLTARAAIIAPCNKGWIAQTVLYRPEILNLGVILQAYYVNPHKIHQLNRLGDCLSIGHYVRSPRALKYGLNFTNNQDFQKLSSKTQKHLTDEVQDCTISYSRDMGVNQTVQHINNPALLRRDTQIRYIYLYHDGQWLVSQRDGQRLSDPIDLRKKIDQLLKKKA